MEPVTHLLTGACLARTGLNRRVAYATAAMAIGAEFPDIDTLWGLRGPITAFQHHRGITHTFIGLPVEAGLLLAAFAFWHRWRARTRRPSRGNTGHSSFAADPPARWFALYGCLLLALLSHILLDYTNNYGVRPFFPFNPQWYAASLVFIFDPLLFLFLLAGLLLPWLLGFVGRQIGPNHRDSTGVVLARAALVAVVCLWALRGVQHHKALQLASLDTLRAPANLAADASGSTPSSGPENTATQDDLAVPTPLAPVTRPLLQPRRILASPDPLSIFRWYIATDFGAAYRLSTVDSLRGTTTLGSILAKPQSSSALVTAQRSYLGRTYGDWSAMPWLSVVQQDEGSSAQTPAQTVFFEDARFLGDNTFLHRGAVPPLTGFVVLDNAGAVVGQGMDGKLQP